MDKTVEALIDSIVLIAINDIQEVLENNKIELGKYRYTVSLSQLEKSVERLKAES